MNVSAVVPGLKTHGGNPSFNKLFLLINLNKGWFPKSQEVPREASKTAQTCEQSTNSVVEDADLHHLMLSGGIAKILPVKKRQQESLWSRKQPHETCKNNQSLFISDWTLYWAELTDAGLHSWNCGLNCTQTGYLMTGALLTMSTVQTEAQGMVQASTDCGGFPPPQKQYEVCQVGRNGNTWSWLRESGPEFRSCGLLKISAEEVSAGRHARTLRGHLLVSPVQRGNSGNHQHDCIRPKHRKRRTITTWLVAVTRAQGSRDWQLQRKQPFVSEELCWWHRARL